MTIHDAHCWLSPPLGTAKHAFSLQADTDRGDYITSSLAFATEKRLRLALLIGAPASFGSNSPVSASRAAKYGWDGNGSGLEKHGGAAAADARGVSAHGA